MSNKTKTIRFKTQDDGSVETLSKMRAQLKDLRTDLNNVEVGSQRFRELQNEIKSTTDRLDQINPKTRDYGKEINKVNEFLKEQRAENRQMNFVFRESQQAIGATAMVLGMLSNTMGGSSLEVKKFTDSLNQGFVTFQGLSFALAAIPGPWGTAIGVIGGAAAALYSFSQASADSVKTLADLDVKLVNILFQMGEVSRESKINALETAIAAANLKMMEANNTTKDWIGTITSLLGSGPLGLGTGALVVKLFGDPTVLKQAQIDFALARKELKEFFKDQEKLIKPEFTQAQKSFFAGFKPLAAGIDQSDKSIQKFQKSVKHLAQTVRGEIPKAWKDVQTGTDALFNHTFDIANQSLNNIAAAMQVGFEAAFSGAAGAGRTFIKSLANGFINMIEGMVIAAEAAAMAKGIVSWGATLIADLPKIALAFGILEGARAVIGKLHDGGSIYFNAPPTQEAYVKVRGQETINVQTPEQRQSSGGVTIVNNFYGPISDEEWVKKLVQDGLRRAGLSNANDYFRNTRGDLALG